MTGTEIELPYGDSQLKAEVITKNLNYVLRTRDVAGLEDVREAITNSLRSPIECPPLVDLINQDDKVVILVTDNTRPCPDDTMVPPILAELERKVRPENITIVVALGLHPPLGKHQLVQKLGQDIVQKYNVINHDVNATIHIGTTSRGTPVDVNTKVVEADFRLSTGLIEPHVFAGFSGGRKSIAPGVLGLRSVYRNHGYKMIQHPSVRAGILQGNPVHEDMVEHAGMAKLNFIVNVLINKRREITHVVAGNPIIAHERGCEIEREIAGVEVNHKVDVTITSNNGVPLDLDLYQTCKGICNAATVTRDGGIIIVASSCNAGVGPEAFRELHASVSSPHEVLQKIRREEPIGVQWANLVLARTQCKNNIYLVSSLNDNVVKDMMITPIHAVEEGLQRAFEALGKDAQVAAIPEGPLVLSLLKH